MTAERAPESGADRLVLALGDPYHLFTRAQVAYLMSTAGRWAAEAATLNLGYAYELGRRSAYREVTELNLAAIEGATGATRFSAARTEADIAQQARRDAFYAAGREPRPGDFPGWGDDPAGWDARADAVLCSWGIDEVRS